MGEKDRKIINSIKWEMDREREGDVVGAQRRQWSGKSLKRKWFSVETQKMSRIMTKGLIGKEKNIAIEKYAGGARRLTWKLTQYVASRSESSSLIPSLTSYPHSQFSLVSNIKGITKQVPSMLKTRTSVLSFYKTTAIFPGSFCWHWRFMRSKSICDLLQIIFKLSPPPLLQSVMTCYWHTFFPVLNKH